jgi:hypothetical protein
VDNSQPLNFDYELPLNVSAMLHVIPKVLSTFYIENLVKLLPCLSHKRESEREKSKIFKVTFFIPLRVKIYYQHQLLTTMHSLNVNFELLWLTKLSSTKIAQRSCTLWIGTASIRSMHLEIIETQEKLSTILALICALSFVQFLCVLHDILLAKDSNPTHFTMVSSYRQTKARIVENRTVCTIMKWVIEAYITSTAV